MIMYVRVAITLKEDCDPQAVFEDMDYSFDDPAILDTELQDVTVVDGHNIRHMVDGSEIKHQPWEN